MTRLPFFRTALALCTLGTLAASPAQADYDTYEINIGLEYAISGLNNQTPPTWVTTARANNIPETGEMLMTLYFPRPNCLATGSLAEPRYNMAYWSMTINGQTYQAYGAQIGGQIVKDAGQNAYNEDEVDFTFMMGGAQIGTAQVSNLQLRSKRFLEDMFKSAAFVSDEALLDHMFGQFPAQVTLQFTGHSSPDILMDIIDIEFGVTQTPAFLPALSDCTFKP